MAARQTGKQGALIETRSYRNFRLEIRDDEGDGWSVTIYAPPRAPVQTVTLRNRVPSGLALLVAEAEARIDRLTDGPNMKIET